jgi:hypothetical protein
MHLATEAPMSFNDNVTLDTSQVRGGGVRRWRSRAAWWSVAGSGGIVILILTPHLPTGRSRRR